MSVDDGVHQVYQIAAVVEEHPHDRAGVLHVPEDGSANNEEIVVHDGH